MLKDHGYFDEGREKRSPAGEEEEEEEEEEEIEREEKERQGANTAADEKILPKRIVKRSVEAAEEEEEEEQRRSEEADEQLKEFLALYDFEKMAENGRHFRFLQLADGVTDLINESFIVYQSTVEPAYKRLRGNSCL